MCCDDGCSSLMCATRIREAAPPRHRDEPGDDRVDRGHKKHLVQRTAAPASPSPTPHGSLADACCRFTLPGLNVPKKERRAHDVERAGDVDGDVSAARVVIGAGCPSKIGKQWRGDQRPARAPEEGRHAPYPEALRGTLERLRGRARAAGRAQVSGAGSMAGRAWRHEHGGASMAARA